MQCARQTDLAGHIPLGKCSLLQSSAQSLPVDGNVSVKVRWLSFCLFLTESAGRARTAARWRRPAGGSPAAAPRPGSGGCSTASRCWDPSLRRYNTLCNGISSALLCALPRPVSSDWRRRHHYWAAITRDRGPKGGCPCPVPSSAPPPKRDSPYQTPETVLLVVDALRVGEEHPVIVRMGRN